CVDSDRWRRKRNCSASAKLSITASFSSTSNRSDNQDSTDERGEESQPSTPNTLSGKCLAVHINR
ncbi:ATP-binding cassette sub-family A member 2, partial [Clarias magur]